MPEQFDEEAGGATLTDEEIVTMQSGTSTAASADVSDTGDDAGDDSGDTGDDSGDTSDVTDTGDDSGDTSDA